MGERVERKSSKMNKLKVTGGLFAAGLVGIACTLTPDSTPTYTPIAPTPIPEGCPDNAKDVILFDGSQYKGPSVRLTEFRTYDMQSEGFGLQTSSICNPNRLHVTIYAPDGNPGYWDKSVPQLPGEFSNRVSTVKVEPESKPSP